MEEEQAKSKKDRKKELEGIKTDQNKDFLGALKSFNVDDI